MIPLKLSLEGMYSYQKKQVVDFQHLTAAELFGIFGATGSGKSSILEAIGFAVYDQTERLGKREPGGLAYNMMNLKSEKLSIDFECLAGAGNQTRYRFSVENRRKKKNFEKTESFKRQSYVWQGDQWVPTDASPMEIIGLSYENFRRCIIIPQGKFEEFLALGNAERTRMLQDLFHLDKYDLKDPVARLNSRNKLDIEHTSGRLATFENITEEAILENDQEMKLMRQQLQTLETEQATVQKSLESSRQLRDQFRQLEEIRQRLTEIESEKPTYLTRKSQLEQYQRTQLTFATPLNELDRMSEELKEVEMQVSRKRQTHEEGEAELRKKEAAFAQTEKTYLTRDVLLKQADELEKVLVLKKYESVIHNKNKRIQDAGQQIDAAEKEEKEQSQRLIVLEKVISLEEARRPDMKKIMEIRSWYSENQRLKENLVRDKQELDKVRNEIEDGKQSKKAISGNIGIDIATHDLPITTLIEQINAQKVDLDQQARQLEERIRAEDVKARLQSLATNLQEGEPCPLCGSTEHPAPAQVITDDETLRQLGIDLEEVKRHQEEINVHLPALERLLTDAKQLGHELKERKTAVNSTRVQLDRQRAAFIWGEYDPESPAKFEAEIEAAQQLDEALSSKKQERIALSDHLARTRDQLGKLRKALEPIQQELASVQALFQQGRKELSLVTYQEERLREEVMISQSIADLKYQHDNVGSLYETLKKEVEERRSRLSILKGELSTLQTRRQTTASQVGRVGQKLDELIAGSDLTDREEVREILAQALDIEAEKDELRRFEREETQAQTSLADIENLVAGKVYDAEAFARLEASFRSLGDQIKQLGQQIGGKEEYRKHLLEGLAEKKRLQAELEAFQKRGENLRILENLFRGNGFVNYISTVYLENLCAAANQRFLKLTGNSLSLEVDADNNFLVRDLLNGGRTRSVKTLSGGQTFQAALCLALALSDQVQRQAEAEQNFFFLDEGFGSQDKHSLRTIFQTLKSLREENRIVGVISHVEELQQEIDTHLQIVNDPEFGSKVYESWA